MCKAQDDQRQYSEATFQIVLSEGQVEAVVEALELYARLGIGQVEELAALLTEGRLPMFGSNAGDNERRKVPRALTDDVKESLYDIKEKLGYPCNGSHGISHPHNHINVSRCYEVLRVVRKPLVTFQQPHSKLRMVDRDGLVVRYTDDQKPQCRLVLDTSDIPETL